MSIGSRVRPTPLAFLAIGWLLLIDVANRIHAGVGSVAALLSVGSLFAMALLLLSERAGNYSEAGFAEVDRHVLPSGLFVFAVWALIGAVLHPTSQGIQNVTVYLGFALGIATTGRLSSPLASEKLMTRLHTVGWVVSLVYLATTATSGLQASTVYSARAAALAALVLLGVAIAQRRSRALPLLLLIVIVVSLSRTATLMAIIVFALGLAVRSNSRGRGIRIIVLLIAAAGGAWVAFTQFAPLRDRFESGDQAFTYGGTKFNVSGRTELWNYTWQSAKHHLWFGGGPGSADAAILRHFVTVSHPHNDYLRLLHDFGIIGASLFVVGYAALLRRTWKLGRTTGQPVHWAAFLGLVGVAGAALTDNVIVYPFVMIPLGILVGSSLSATPPRGPAPERVDRTTLVGEMASTEQRGPTPLGGFD